MTAIREKYVGKINALLRKAEGTDSQAEADALFSKAQELMTKWAIDEAMLAEAKGTDAASLNIVKNSTTLRTNFFMEDARILDAVARANNATVLLSPMKPAKGERLVYVIGDEPDVERTMLLFTSVYIQMGQELSRRSKTDPDYAGRDRMWRKRYRMSFRLGFAMALRDRLLEVQVETAGDHLPALRDKAAQVDDWVRENMNAKVSRSRGKTTHTGAYIGGFDAGQRADVGNPRVGGSRGAIGQG